MHLILKFDKALVVLLHYLKFKVCLQCWKKCCLLLKKIKANTVNTCLLWKILKILIWNMLNSMKESPSFHPFKLCITSWGMSETEIWPFLRLLRMNSSELQYRDQLISERKNWIGCNYRPNTVIDMSMCEFYLHHRTRSSEVKSPLFHVVI